ncbi:MAG: hypothetical protein ABSB87_13750 [Terriglobales bacterium]|jgi:PleD family two-component response regulator
MSKSKKVTESPDETSRILAADNHNQAADKIRRIKNIVAQDFDNAVSPKMALINVWLILQGVPEREGLL